MKLLAFAVIVAAWIFILAQYTATVPVADATMGPVAAKTVVTREDAARGAEKAALEPQSEAIETSDGVSIPVARFGQSRRDLILWFPSENAFVSQERAAARALASEGAEVWLVDTLGGRFLPVLPSSLEEIPGTDVAAALTAAKERAERVYLITAGRGAVPVLQGLRAWDATCKKPGAQAGAVRAAEAPCAVAGVILLYPNVYVATPEAGEDAQYLPVVDETVAPVSIIQGELSPWYWRLEDLTSRLRKAGSVVTTKTLPGTRDRFHAREDPLAGLSEERRNAEQFPELIVERWQQLKSKSGDPK